LSVGHAYGLNTPEREFREACLTDARQTSRNWAGVSQAPICPMLCSNFLLSQRLFDHFRVERIDHVDRTRGALIRDERELVGGQRDIADAQAGLAVLHLDVLPTLQGNRTKRLGSMVAVWRADEVELAQAFFGDTVVSDSVGLQSAGNDQEMLLVRRPILGLIHMRLL